MLPLLLIAGLLLRAVPLVSPPSADALSTELRTESLLSAVDAASPLVPGTASPHKKSSESAPPPSSEGFRSLRFATLARPAFHVGPAAPSMLLRAGRAPPSGLF